MYRLGGSVCQNRRHHRSETSQRTLTLFLISLIGILVQDFGLFVLADAAKLAGPMVAVLQGVVLIVAIGLIVLSRKAVGRGWLS